MSHIASAVGQKIRKVRELKGFSQEYVAKQLNITQKSYSNIELGKTKLDFERLDQISEVLEIDPLNILTFDEQILFNNYHQAQMGSFSVYYGAKLEGQGKDQEKRIEQMEKELQAIREEVKFLRGLIQNLTKQ